jgi:ankyrin repeat protein
MEKIMTTFKKKYLLILLGVIFYKSDAIIKSKISQVQSNLMHYIQTHNVAEAKSLIDEITQKELVFKESDGTTPLMQAILNKLDEVALLLIGKLSDANLTEQNDEGNTAILLAINNNSLKIIDKLIEKMTKKGLEIKNYVNESAISRLYFLKKNGSADEKLKIDILIKKLEKKIR